MIKETMFSGIVGEVNRLRPPETELERLQRIEISIFTEMAAAERVRSSAMENYCRKDDKGMGAGRTGTGEGAEDVL